MEGETSERNRGTENKNQSLIIFLINKLLIPFFRKVHFTYHEGQFLQDKGKRKKCLPVLRNDSKDAKKMTNHTATFTVDISIAVQRKVKSPKS